MHLRFDVNISVSNILGYFAALHLQLFTFVLVVEWYRKWIADNGICLFWSVFDVLYFIRAIDDPLSAFEKILREKDLARERNRRRKRSFSRSPSPRLRSRSPPLHRKRSAISLHAWGLRQLSNTTLSGISLLERRLIDNIHKTKFMICCNEMLYHYQKS